MAHTTLTLPVVAPWYADWAWGLPLIGLTVVIHAIGLLFISQSVDNLKNRLTDRYGYRVMFVVITGATAMLAAALHGIEGAIWAAAYQLCGAAPGYREAVLYSLSAMTTYGHERVVLATSWRFLGALEALNGMLLFGLTTAFLFDIIQRVRQLNGSPSNGRKHPPDRILSTGR